MTTKRGGKERRRGGTEGICSARRRQAGACECGRRRTGTRECVCGHRPPGEWDRARVCVGIFDEHSFTSRPMGRFDRGTEGDRACMTTHYLREQSGGGGLREAAPKSTRVALPGLAPLWPERRATREPAGIILTRRSIALLPKRPFAML
jgi:hypothetical protein